MTCVAQKHAKHRPTLRDRMFHTGKAGKPHEREVPQLNPVLHASEQSQPGNLTISKNQGKPAMCRSAVLSSLTHLKLSKPLDAKGREAR